MAKQAINNHRVTIRLACQAFKISETCYRYNPKLSSENELIADWLLRLTTTHKQWGFGLCFMYLRNTKGFKWNHKRVYRIYKQLELNLRIKPRRRIKRDKPKAIRCDNGPEYISHALREWAQAMDIELMYIQPGKPTQNAYIERFNRTARNEWLNMHIFDSIEHAQNLATQWMWVYNNERPHSSIGGIPPRKLLEAI
jgi:putative transposase